VTRCHRTCWKLLRARVIAASDKRSRDPAASRCIFFPSRNRICDRRVRGLSGRTAVESSTRAFFVGVGTTFIILGAGFGGGLMLAKNVMEPAPSAPFISPAGRLPPARVILPASAEPAMPPAPSVAAPAPKSGPQVVQPQIIQTKEIQQPSEKDRQAERAERRKAETGERERRRRTAERKAKGEAARLARQQQQPQAQPGIMAFGGDNEQPSFGSGLFGN